MKRISLQQTVRKDGFLNSGKALKNRHIMGSGRLMDQDAVPSKDFSFFYKQGAALTDKGSVEIKYTKGNRRYGLLHMRRSFAFIIGGSTA